MKEVQLNLHGIKKNNMVLRILLKYKVILLSVNKIRSSHSQTELCFHPHYFGDSAKKKVKDCVVPVVQ